MSSLTREGGRDTHTWRRVLGVHDTGIPGPTLISLGGVHGNEPAGVHALTRVLDHLKSRSVPLRGRLVALAGNLSALAAGERFVDRALNRSWAADDIEALRAAGEPAAGDTVGEAAEDHEQRELLELLDKIIAEANGPVIFLDLHTSSAHGPSFSCMSDTLANRRIALVLRIPVILGLEECIDGALMEYFNCRRMPALAVEGGRHDDPESVRHLEAAVYLALDAVRMLSRGTLDLREHREALRRSAKGQPPVLEILHHQHVEPGDEFEMEPGFRSFAPVAKGQLLARYNGIELRAPETCRILLPLYQGQGEDGFFLARPVGKLWLRLAAVLRRLRLHAILHWLPGVRRHPDKPGSLLVEPRIARFFCVPLFHLLGFRRQGLEAGKVCFPDVRTRHCSRSPLGPELIPAAAARPAADPRLPPRPTGLAHPVGVSTRGGIPFPALETRTVRVNRAERTPWFPGPSATFVCWKLGFRGSWAPAPFHRCCSLVPLPSQ